MVNLKLKNTIGFTLGIFIFFTMGCERELNEIIAQSDDTTVVDGETDKKPSSGSVVIVGSAKKFGTELTEDYHFDLTPIKTLYQKAYRQAAGTIILRLKDAPDGKLIYEFSM